MVSIEQQMNQNLPSRGKRPGASTGTMPGTSPETSTGIIPETSTGTSIIEIDIFKRFNV